MWIDESNANKNLLLVLCDDIITSVRRLCCCMSSNYIDLSLDYYIIIFQRKWYGSYKRKVKFRKWFVPSTNITWATTNPLILYPGTKKTSSTTPFPKPNSICKKHNIRKIVSTIWKFIKCIMTIKCDAHEMGMNTRKMLNASTISNLCWTFNFNFHIRIWST